MRRSTILLAIAGLMVLSGIAYAHTYSDNTVPATCGSGSFCYYDQDNFNGNGVGWTVTSTLEVNQIGEPWDDRDYSAGNKSSLYRVRVWEGANLTGDNYCITPNRGKTNLPFHHDGQADSLKTVSSC
jgi:hypothetical protein